MLLECISCIIKMNTSNRFLAVNFLSQVSSQLVSLIEDRKDINTIQNTLKIFTLNEMSSVDKSLTEALPSSSIQVCVQHNDVNNEAIDSSTNIETTEETTVCDSITQYDQIKQDYHNKVASNLDLSNIHLHKDNDSSFLQSSPQIVTLILEDNTVHHENNQNETEQLVIVSKFAPTDEMEEHFDDVIEIDNDCSEQTGPNETTEVSEYKCFECPEFTFESLQKLVKHTKKHNTKPFVCDICYQGFATKGSLTVHMRRHTGHKPYQCDTCDQAFTTPGNLKRHKAVHTGEKPFQCELCFARFSCKKNVESHMLTHTKEKPYSCDVCKARFTHAGSLNTHMNIHKNKKPYVCDVCNKTFVQKSNMKTHKMRHSSDRNFGCDYCASRFHTKSDLVRHACSHIAGAVGTQVTLFPCRLCKKSFSRKHRLTNHIQKEHKT